MKLYERIPIDIWKKIADIVQNLNIYDFTEEEFKENLILLTEGLHGLDLSLDYLDKYPNIVSEVGLKSLLQTIYSSNVYNDYKKANFYEKIYQLDHLEIPYIEFRPVDFPLEMNGISLVKDEINDDVIGVNSCFTDGEFNIHYSDLPLNRWFDMVNLKDANYLLKILVNKGMSGTFINPNDSYAILKNFNGEFPNKETLHNLFYPGFSLYSRYLDDYVRQFYLKQVFHSFDNSTVLYTKKLVRSYGNYHYE